MRLSRLWAILASPTLLFFVNLATPMPAHADTYQIVGINIDNALFYGLSTTGQVVLYTNNDYCSSASTCYGHDGDWSPILPALTWDDGTACTSPLSLSSGYPIKAATCNNGYSVYYGPENSYGKDDLYASAGSTSPQLLYSGFFAGPIYMNSLGDIVFDDAALDEWDEAIDLTTTTAATLPTPTNATTPEPSTLLLLATGILAPIFFLRRRRTATAAH